MDIEVVFCVLVGGMIAFFYFVSAWMKSRVHMLHGELVATIAGALMIMLGFWGSDAAFVSTMVGVHEIYISLLGLYTCLDWWNLNWFTTLTGSVILSWGTFMIGRSFPIGPQGS